MRLLVIDDSPTMRALLGFYARDLDFETVEAQDGRDGLEKLATAGPFDGALIDWDMPQMNGLELLRVIRGRAGTVPMKVLMVTAKNTMDNVNEALAAGADDYLMKPIDEPMLADKLRMLGLGS